MNFFFLFFSGLLCYDCNEKIFMCVCSILNYYPSKVGGAYFDCMRVKGAASESATRNVLLLSLTVG